MLISNITLIYNMIYIYQKYQFSMKVGWFINIRRGIFGNLYEYNYN